MLLYIPVPSQKTSHPTTREGQVEVKTVQQMEAALTTLQQLVNRSKDLLPETKIVLWTDDHRQGIPYGPYSWSKLTLSKAGLRLESGYRDICTDPEGCMTDHKDEIYEPKLVTVSVETVTKYKLEESNLREVLAQLA